MRDPRDVFVIDYGGIYGLYVQANTIEMFGLCNEDIALKGNTHGINPVFRKTGLDCYLAFNPDDFHANRPFLRPLDAFKNQAQMIKAVFQGKALDRVLDLKKRYATGRVIDTETNQAVWFLERRRPDRALQRREPAPGIVVDYPFEKAVKPKRIERG